VSDERLFTLQEANAELEDLRRLLPRIREARRALIAASEKIDEAVSADGGGIAAPGWFAHQQTLRAGVEDLARRGVLLRDPDLGIVDFPAERDGVRIFLCWRLGESAVGHFHGELGGYARRRPL
jgi:hypothetical protein